MTKATALRMTRDKWGVVAQTARIVSSIAWERTGPPVRLATADTVPPSAESITPEWLTLVLCHHVEGARVIDVDIIGGHDGTSARRGLTVRYNDAGVQAQLPSRLFSKSTSTVGARLLLGITGITEGESIFYSAVRAELKLRSPRAYYARYDPKSHRSMVLLEDMTSRGWTFPDPMRNPVTKQDAEDMLAELAAYHSALWDSPRFNTDLQRLRSTFAWQDNLNRKVGFERRTLTGLQRAMDVVPASLHGQRHLLYPAFMQPLAMHRSHPETLLHQDLHLGNWLRDDNGRMGLYDWQCVARGHWALDCSYALAGALDTHDRREWQEDLLRHYLQHLRENGVTPVPTFDEAWLTYRQQPLHALALALFTLGGSRFEPELQPRAYTLAAIKRIAQHVADLESISAVSK